MFLFHPFKLKWTDNDYYIVVQEKKEIRLTYHTTYHTTTHATTHSSYTRPFFYKKLHYDMRVFYFKETTTEFATTQIRIICQFALGE